MGLPWIVSGDPSRVAAVLSWRPIGASGRDAKSPRHALSGAPRTGDRRGPRRTGDSGDESDGHGRGARAPAARARRSLAAVGLGRRCRVVAGDLFRGVPERCSKPRASACVASRPGPAGPACWRPCGQECPRLRERPTSERVGLRTSRAAGLSRRYTSRACARFPGRGRAHCEESAAG